jgi:hypothetical protein
MDGDNRDSGSGTDEALTPDPGYDFSWRKFWDRFHDSDLIKDYTRLTVDDLWHVVFYWEGLPFFRSQKGDDVSFTVFNNGEKAAAFIAMAAKQNGLDESGFRAGHEVYRSRMIDALRVSPIDTTDTRDARKTHWSAEDFLNKFAPGERPSAVDCDLFNVALSVAKRVEAWANGETNLHGLRFLAAKNEKWDCVAVLFALAISTAVIVGFEVFVYLLPWNWLKNHPNSFSLQACIGGVILSFILGLRVPGWRKVCWSSTTFLGIVLVGVSLLGGPKSSMPSTIP